MIATSTPTNPQLHTGKANARPAVRMVFSLLLSALCWAAPQYLNATNTYFYGEGNGNETVACGSVFLGGPNPVPVYLNAMGQATLAGTYGPFPTGVDMLGVSTSNPGNYLFYYTGSTMPGTSMGTGTGAVGLGNYTFNCSQVYAVTGTDVTLYVNSALTAFESTTCNVVPVTVRVFDNLAPSITTCPPNITVACTSALPAVANSYAGFQAANGVASDNCSTLTASYVDVTTPGACPNKYTIARTWTVRDASNNPATCTQTISVSDNVAPTTSGSAGTLTLNCNTYTNSSIDAWIANNTNPTSNPSVINAVAGWISGDGTLDATDNCTGNTVTITASPATGAAVMAAMPAACSPAPRQVFVDFTVSDGCGNTVVVQGMVVLADPNAPTGSAPTALNINCDVLPAPHTTIAAFLAAGGGAIDNCTPQANLTVTHVSTTAQVGTGNGCPAPGAAKVYDRVYHVTDCSNNTLTVTQTITYLDATPPVWQNSPTDLMVACDNSNISTLITNWINSVGTTGLATDNCGGTVTYSAFIQMPGTPAATVASVTAALDAQTCLAGVRQIQIYFEARDACGNLAAPNRTGHIIRTDFVAPTASNPAPLTAVCAAEIPAANVLVVTDEADNCTPTANLVVAYTGETNNGGTGCPASPRIYTRSYTVTDECSNTKTVTQTITQIDNVAPTFATAPVDISIEGCAASAASDITIINWYNSNITDGAPGADGTDNTGVCLNGNTPNIVASKTLAQIQSDLLAQPCDQTTHLRSTTVSFKVIDACGNESAPVTVNVTVRDMVAPTASNPAAVNVVCASAIPTADPAVVIDEADNCPGTLTVAQFGADAVTGLVPPCTNRTIMRTYRVTDVCGNTVDVTQTISVNDNIIPTAICQSVTKDLSATLDGAGTVTVMASELNNGSSDNCGGALTYEFRIPAGSAAQQVFQTSHTLTCADIANIANCAAAPSNTANLLVEFRVIDVCNNISLNCSGPGTFITLRDLTAPVIGNVAFPCPANLTVNTSANGTGDCTASGSWNHPMPVDNCSISCFEMQIEKMINGVYVIQSTSAVTGGTSAGSLTFIKGPLCTDDKYRITYTAKDEHGNVATPCSFIVTVVDDEMPVLTCPTPNTVNLVAVPGDCYQTYSWIRPTATDNCQPPSGPCPPPTVVVSTINGVAVPPGTPVTAAGIVINTIGLSDVATFPVGTTTIVYKATDAQGVMSFCTLTVNVADTQAPVAMCVGNFTTNLDPNGTKTLCFSDIDAGSWDNCILATKEISLNGGAFASCVTLNCLNIGANTITLRVCDASAPTPLCNTCTMTVTVTDAQTPGFAFCPGDIVGTTSAPTCDSTFTLPIPTVYNNGCNGTVNATFVSATYINGTRQAIGSAVAVPVFPTGTTAVKYKYEYTNSGGSLQTIYCDYTVTIIDNDKPTIVCPAAVNNLDCQTSTPAPLTLAAFTGGTLTDNCGVTQLLFSDLDNQLTACPSDGLKSTTRTYIAFDAAGNSSTCTQVFTWIDDVVPPTFSGTAADVTGVCANQVTPVPAVTAIDNVGGCAGVTIDYEEILTDWDGVGAPSCTNKFRITRTWVATDACGNSATTTQLVTINDNIAPIFDPASLPPAVVNEKCIAAVLAPANVTASDNTGGQCGIVVVTLSETENPGPQNCPNSTIITRTWTATDDCDNSTQFTQTITVNDDVPPVLSPKPADILNLTCATQVTPAPVVTATDNCTVVFVDYSEVVEPGNCVNRFTLKRTWKATDACGNMDVHTQTITVNDQTSPVFANTPASILAPALACADLVPAVVQPNTGGAFTVTDNCTVLSVDFAEITIPGNCVNQYSIVRRWVATDACGLTSMTSQVIVINDNVPPVLAGLPAPPNPLPVACAQLVPAAPTVTATDNCDAAVNVIYSEELAPGTCPNKFTIKRTWTAEDLCGNKVTATHHIVVDDTVAPTWNEPAPTNFTGVNSLNCGEDVPAVPTQTATDNCGVPVYVDFSEVTDPGTCPNDFIITRRWTAMDDCGNVTTRTQVISVFDNIKPVLAGLPTPALANPLNVACGDLVPAAPVVTATDNCDNQVNVIYSEELFPGNCVNQFSIKRTWSAEDLCGNLQTATHIIVVNDNVAPVINVPPFVLPVYNYECADQVPGPPGLTATDNCDANVNVIYTETSQYFSCVNHFVINRKWTAVDMCGNSSTWTMIINVKDETAPVINVPPFVLPVYNYQCADQVPGPPGLTATDNCDANINVIYTENTQYFSCVNSFVINRKWTAVDMCGNSSTWTMIINVKDDIAPTLVGAPAQPSVVNVSCAQNVPAAAVVTATDNCDANVNVIYTEELVPGTCANKFSIKRTWTAEDLCGNKTTATQTINVDDSQAPIWNEPAPTTPVNIACAALVPVVPTQTVTDNCGVPIDVDFVEVDAPGSCVNKFTKTRTWTATDDCGNSTQRVQVINVDDSVAPVLVGLPAATINGDCADDVPAAPVVTATDNCGNGLVDVEFTESTVMIGNCPNKFKVTRTWTAEDLCGNATSFVQTITIDDNIAPVLVGLPAATVTGDCADDVPAVPVVTATDNCGNGLVDVEFTESTTQIGNCPNKFKVTRTWTAQDGCGNATSFVQTITIDDNIAPVLVGLPAATVTGDCADDVPAVPVVTATDNCGNGLVDVEFTESTTQIGNCPNKFTVTRTWTAQDGCGNATSFVQTITIDDNVAPTLVGLPAATVNGDCADDVPAVPVVTATDNCGNNLVDVEFTEATTLIGNCPNKFTVTRTWTAQDGCGNATSFVQTITINDDVAPVLAGVPTPAVLNVSCAQDVPMTPVVTALDNCNGVVNVIYTEELAPGTCANKFTIKRKWTAEDACGNVVTATQTINVDDSVAPVFSTTPATPVNVACAGDVPAAPVVTASDNCGVPIIVQFVESTIPGPCVNKFTVIRTWTASDDCGNATSMQQVINVNDNVAPVLTCPAPLNAQCSANEIPPYANWTAFLAAGGTASDNCQLNQGTFGLKSVSQVGNVVTRTYRIFDACGNEGTCTQTITVLDNTPPTFLNCPTTTLVFGNDPNQCSAKVNWPDLVAVDNCTIPTVAQTSGPLSGTVVPVGTYTIVYTATDAAGNTGVCSFTVMVMDTEKPTFDADILMPGNVTVECDAVPAPFVLTNNDVSDNCTPSANLVIAFTEVRTNGNCANNYTLTRTWKVTDASNNMLVHTQVITVKDTKPPVAICKDITVTLGLNGTVTITGAQINNGSTDNCSSAANLTYTASPNVLNCSHVGVAGGVPVTLTVTDQCGNSATCVAKVTVLEGAGACTPFWDIANSQKCVCKDNATTQDNGQFNELLQIKALAGQTWTLAAGSTGVFLTTSAAPPAAPTPMAVGTQMLNGVVDGYNNDGDAQTDEADEAVYYTIRFVHVEGVGFTANFTNNIGQTVNAVSKCYYPTPTFTNLDGPYCLGTPAFNVVVTDAFGGTGTFTLTIDGNPVNPPVFNANTLGVGSHNVVATFDAGVAGMNDITNPGCKQTISKIVEVVTTPTAIVCNDFLQVSLDESCVVTIVPDMVLEGGYACYDDYTVTITYPAGTSTFTPPNKVNASHVGKTLKYKLTHVASGNSCWGDIFVEDKLAPKMVCPGDLTVQCSQTTAPGTTGVLTVTDCSTFTTSVSDVYTDFGQCANPRAQIIRTWTAVDKWGNAATCSQKITIAAFDLANVAFPADLTLNCTNVGLNPDLTDPSNSGRPTIGGSAIAAGSVCMASVSMTDEIYDICANSYEIIRTWKVRNMCLPLSATNPVTHTQIIKVLDNQGPQMVCPADFTISVNALVCKATLDVPDVEFFEACSGLLSFKAELSNGSSINYGYVTLPPNGNIWTDNQLAVFGNINNLPVGTYTLKYTAEDNCANVSTCTTKVTVIDGVPPVAICQEYTQVAIGGGNVDNFTCPGETGPNGPLNDTPGDAVVAAELFNSGSYDACGPVWFKVRRMNGGSCSNTEFNDNVRFCCSDIGTEWMVVFRVYDVDPGAGQIAADALEGHFTDCMVTVLVEDKLKPACQAPANKTVNCDEFDPLVWYGNLTYFDNCGIKNIDTATTYVPNQIAFEQCNYGQVRRTFTVYDCGNNSSRCTQTITVNYKEQYRVYFPDDKNITVCNGTTLLEQPVIFGENCELIGITHSDETFDVVPDACYKILRTFRVINWCTYNPNLADVVIQNSNTSTQGARVWIGAGVANYNPNDPETPTIAAKMWNYPAPLTGTATNPEGTPAYVYTQIIKVQDATPPQANIDPQLGTADYTFCDYSTNDPLQWNEDASYNPWGVAGTWSPTCQSHDLCEGIVDLSILATDDCSDDNLNFRYLLFLDLNGDGVMETTINSEIPTLGFGIREDELTTIAGVKYRIGRVTRDFETDDPDHTKYSSFALPYGTHKIKWIVEDRCGNDFTKEWPIIVKDCKNPTVVCINGLSVNQMNIPAGAGMAPSVTLWATDFLQYAEDNCTDASDIDLALRDADINPGTGFPLDANGDPQSSLSWDCSQVGTNVVELWARDKWGNADFCLTYLILSDNTGICNGNGVIAGLVKTKPQFDDPATNVGGVTEVNVALKEVNPVSGVPGLSNFPTSNNGEFIFAGIPLVGDYEVTPTKDINPLNGVSTFDLVRMSKHVLNVQPFTTGYQYVAADINNNGQVTTFDIVELRKLILGIYTDFPANDSWRFVDKNHVFDMSTPLASMPASVITTAGTFDNNFIGVKTGDLTGDAIANNFMSTDDRTFGTVLFETTDRAVKAGETFEMNFAAQELVKGGQFTLTFAGLEALEIVPGNGMNADNFALFADQNLLTTSFNGDVKATFSVKFRAKADGQLREMVKISSRVTKAEAYRESDDQKLDIALAFRAGLGIAISEVGFELYQNQPNPFVDRTSIGFHLPADSEAALRVFDANGRLVHEQKGQFTKGYHNFFVSHKDLPVKASVLYYEVKTADDAATKSMILMH